MSDTRTCDSAVLVSLFRGVVRSRSPSGITLRLAVSTSLMNLDCSGMTAENSASRALFLIKYFDFVVLVTLTATFSLITVEIESRSSELAVLEDSSSGVTVTVSFHSERCST